VENIRPIQISVIIPTLNGVGRIEGCLESLLEQDIPRESYEIIVVDDESSDATVEVCLSLNVDRVLVSGKRDIEWSKALGVNNSSGRYVLFIDDDNRLVGKSWLSNAIKIMEDDQFVGGVEAGYFSYRKEDAMANRYCALMGTNDPLVYYLRRTDRLTYFDKGWTKASAERYEDVNLIKLRFDGSEIPTLGSQGFLTTRELISDFPFTNRFLHMDFCAHISTSRRPFFVLTKNSVDHDHCDSSKQFVKKCRRNAMIYLADGGSRNYSYELSLWKKTKLALICLTFVIPIRDSIRGFSKVRDVAWFLHPILSCWVFIVYSKLSIRDTLKANPKLISISQEATKI
jgi:glycosyltransferase involved in cell wall biosynthesis